MTDGLAEGAEGRLQPGAVRQPLRLRRRSTPSPSTRTRRASRARPAAPRSTSGSAWCGSARVIAGRSRGGRGGRRDHRLAGRRRSIRRLLEASRRRCQGAARRLVLHRRHRLLRCRRRSVRHRPGRRHDHHRRRERLAGGDRKLPVAASGVCSEVAVVGLPDERWGKIVTAFVKRRPGRGRGGARRATAAAPAWPISSGRAATSSSTDIPKSPVGKLLRRMLVAGE